MANVKTVYILFSCPGGGVVNGFNVYNILSGMPFESIIHNVGQVDSIGTLIFCGAKKRYATPSSTFMFHGIGNTIQNQRIEEKGFRAMLDNVLQQQERLSAEYIKNTSLTQEEVKEFFRDAITIDAQTALDKGVIHEIRDLSIIAGCPIISHVPQ